MIKLSRNRIVIFTAIMIVLTGFLFAEYAKGSESPRFAVGPDDDWVVSWWPWTPGATISLTIEDGSGVVYTDSQTADTDGNFLFNLWGVFDLQRGHVVTVSDGTNTKTHTVTNLLVDSVDVPGDVVYGRADAGTSVHVEVHGDGSNLTITADGSGNWTADFSGMTDITYLSDGESQQTDDDGDSTWVRWATLPGTVEIDIKPGSVPNCINPDSKGRIAVAILCGDAYDVYNIDPGTIYLDGVAPLRWSLNKDVNGDDCNDLVFHFNTQELNGEGLLIDGNALNITGELFDGTPISGSDTINLAGGPYCFD